MLYNPHKKIALFFLSLTSLLFLATLVFLLTRQATMIVLVKPRPERVLLEKIIRIPRDFKGEIITLDLVEEKTFSPKASLEVESVARGEVQIVNNSTQNLNLVKATRFLSVNNVLFRLEDKTLVPAKRTTKAILYANKAGSESEIEPTRFTLPGLSEPTHSLVYAENKEKMKGGVKKIGLVTDKDLEEAQKNVEEILTERATKTLQEKVKEKGISLLSWKFIRGKEETIITSDVKAGEEKGEFKIKGNKKIVLISYNENDLIDLMTKLAKDKLPNDKILRSIEPHTLLAELKKLATDNKSADLKVSLKITTVIKENSAIFDLAKLKTMSPQEIKTFLEQYKEIELVKLKFNPFWKTKTPEKNELIKIIIRE